MNHIRGKDRQRPILGTLEEQVEPEAFVRIIDAFVDGLDMESFGFSYFQLNPEGRPPYHPSVLMKLYLYGYRNGIRSSRKLARACKINLEMMWLVEGRQPCFKTINNFRSMNSQAFRAVFRHFVLMLRDWKLIGGKPVAIDSFKIRAQNSLKNNYNEAKIGRHLKYIDKKILEYERALEASADQDGGEQKGLLAKIEAKKEKKAFYQELEQQLEESEEAQLSTTDPDARAVVFQRKSVKVGYNVQAATDARHKLLVAMETGDVNDTAALSPMVEQVQQNISKKKFDALGDKGYHSGRELKACEELGVKTYISPKGSASPRSKKHYPIERFVYNKKQDSYTCPAGEILHTNGRYYQKSLKNGRKSYRVKHYKTRACEGCPLRAECTQNKSGRVIERSEFQEYITRNNERVEKNPEYYRQRQCLIEHPFGTLKRQWGFDHTLLCGKEKVLAEVSLAFTCYNLVRMVSIWGFEQVWAQLKADFWQILVIFLLSARAAAQRSKFYFGYRSPEGVREWPGAEVKF